MEVKRNVFRAPHDRRAFLRGLVTGGCGLALMSKGRIHGAGPRSETKARFFTAMEGGIVQCHLCFRGCVLEDGETGHCEVRVNRGGTLMTMAYGNPGALNVDPIEKKPFFHFKPGTTAFSLATVGCNIDCKFCQNWQIAQAKPGDIRTYSMTPEAIAKAAKSYGCPTIAYTYSEPTVWSEYVIACTIAGKKEGLDSVIVSNGTWSKQLAAEHLKRLRAVKIDLKSIEPDYYKNICNAELKPVLETILRVKKAGVWLELVNLVVTSLNDSDSNFKKLARWVKTNLGPDVPVHFTRFHPMYRLKNLSPTPLRALDNAYDIARAEGLHYVYVGNVPGHRGQNTLCPSCGELLIQRKGFAILNNVLKNGKCPVCHTEIPGIWA